MKDGALKMVLKPADEIILPKENFLELGMELMKERLNYKVSQR